MSLFNVAKATIRNSRNKIKTKITLDDVIATYPDGVTITGVSLTENRKYGGHFWSFTFAEDDGKYFYAQGDMTKIADDWLDSSDGDVEELNSDLADEPIKIKICKVKTKSGNMYTRAEIV